MNKTLSLMAALGLMAAAPVAANAEMGQGTYAAFDVGFASIDHELNDDIEAGGTSIGLNAAVGYRQPVNLMGMDMFWGAELGFGFGTLDEDETTSSRAAAVDPDGASGTTGGADACANAEADTAADTDCTAGIVGLNQTFTAEESWNLNLSADIGMMVDSNTLAFLRVGYVFAGGADATYKQEAVAPDTGAPTTTLVTYPFNNPVYANALYDDATAAAPTYTYTGTGNSNNVADKNVEEADASIVVGVGGEYDMSDVSPGLSVRGLALYNIGDRSGVDIRVGVGWQF